MKPIHFCRAENYDSILDAFIDPILPFLSEYTMSNSIMPGSVNVIFFLEKIHRGNNKELKVFIPHGLADKNYRQYEDLVEFDYIFISGRRWFDKTKAQKILPNRIFMTGYTKLDPIFRGDIKPVPGDRKKILWAPTHNNGTPGFSSYPDFEETLTKIPSNYQVLSSIHPGLSKGSGVTMQLLADADVVIADSGSTIYEAWSLGKQVIFPDYLVKEAVMSENTFERMIYKEGIGIHASSEAELLQLIYYACNKPLEYKVINFVNSIFDPKLRGISGQITAGYLKRIAKTSR